MSIDFKDIIKFYKNAEIITKNQLKYKIYTDEQKNLIEKLTSDDNCFSSKIFLIYGKLEKGSEITLQTEQIDISIGILYETVEEFIKFDIQNVMQPDYVETPYYIKLEKISSYDSMNDNLLLTTYYEVKKFIQNLINMCSYKDNVGKKLIFFNKKIFEVSLNIEENFSYFYRIIQEMTITKKMELINFNQWIEHSINDQYEDKKVIFSFVLSVHYMKKIGIIDIILEIEDILRAVEAQFSIYMEKNSYHEFIKKIEEDNRKFIIRINDTVSKVLPQLLGLPFLAAIITIFSADDSIGIYLAFCLYCLVCLITLEHQKCILDFVHEDIEFYPDPSGVPVNVKKQWLKNKNNILTLIFHQNMLYYLLISSATICFGLGLSKIIYIFKEKFLL